MLSFRRFLEVLLVLLISAAGPDSSAMQELGQTVRERPGEPPAGLPGNAELEFDSSGYTNYGEWYATVSINPPVWKPGAPVTVNSVLLVFQSHLEGLAAAGIKADGFCLLVTAERTFDANGWIRLGSDERMSTLITPTGLPIEGGVQGAVTDRYAYGFRTPVDLFQAAALSAGRRVPTVRKAAFSVKTDLPGNLPPGIYRIRLDFGVTSGKRIYSLNGEAFAQRPFFSGRPTESNLYSPPLRASGVHVSGRDVDASSIKPRLPWVLLANYNSNGYRGIVADEDQARFGISGRNLIQDEVILPLYDDNNNKLSYSLEPQFPTDTIELRSNIPWNYASGELSIKLTGPDGKTVDLGKAPFVGQTGQWPTTRNSSFTAWKPAAYGQYTAQVSGWIADTWGNRYEGGGTYHFWIAKRMTLATATFQGMAYPTGSKYGRDLGFAPAVPAYVEATARLFPYSDPDPAKLISISYSGNASPSGIFGAAQGLKQLSLDYPGEYRGHILARYKDSDGHLWVCAMTHAGVVYPPDSPIVARGKKLTINGKYVDRGETHFEGWVDTATETSYLHHINFPFLAGDMLLIASEQQGANKIEPVMLYEKKSNPEPYSGAWQSIGRTNLQLRTSNGYSPHMFPEYITDWAYYYGAAPRPGFMSRFLIGEDGVRAPYWPTSPNSFGGQINASSNGDLPGDIYRLLGGVVLRKKGEAPAYAGYISSAFLLPRGSNNNRVVASGSEDVTGPYGTKARFFLVGTRPGMMYEVGTAFGPAVQVDPILPASVTCILRFPDGRQKVWTGTGDTFGTFASADRVAMDTPGIYRFSVEGDWQSHKGCMPGLPATGGEIYVVEKDRPAGAQGLRLNLANQSVFPAASGLNITGMSTAESVHYAAVMPGAALAQGDIPVRNGRFEYFFNPALYNSMTATYDINNLVSGRPEIGDVVHLTFFSKEVMNGIPYHSFVRLIIRGNRAFYAR